MRTVVLAMVVAIGGCVHADSVTCDDGSLCPVGTTCESYPTFTDRPLRLCVPDAVFAPCVGQPEHAPCGAVGDQRCYAGACLPGGCGNGIADPGESCDDGNQAPRDGCSADCRSLEVCGNGIVDGDVGETCDDHDTLSRDGCTSTCETETDEWTAMPQFPTTRTGARLAYDSGRDVVVMWGGDPASGSSVTPLYEYDDRAWRARASGGPHVRRVPAMAYDPEERATIVYGDTGSHDTWAWDGAAWHELSPPADPGLRASAALAWDPALHALVLYGGAAAGGALSDTWTWNGATWTELAAALPAGTPALADPQLAYDFARDVLVLAGVVSDAQSGTQHRAICELDATGTWHAVAATGAPNGTAATLAWDPIARAVVLTSFAANQPWHAWDGAAWTIITAAETFGGEALLATRGRRGDAVVFLGQQFYAHTGADAWELTGILGQGPDEHHGGAAAAYDPLRRRVLWIGGAGHQQEVWTWADGWAQLPDAPAGAAFLFAGAAYDGARDRFVVFGGSATAVDTWTVDAATLTDWRHETPATSPPGRLRAALAFDEARGEVVLFGGTGTASVPLGDTWTWDGATWTERAVGGAAPSARVSSIAYDAVRGKTVLWGGSTGSTNDTWEWDGAAWTQIATPTSPEAAQATHLAWDAGRRRVVLVGESVLLDAWAFDGATWRELAPGDSLDAKHIDYTLVSDPSGAGVVILDAVDGASAAPNDTVRLREEGAREEACIAGTDFDGDGLAGCDDPDCAFACAPLGAGGPRCGDGACDDRFETPRTCPADCRATLCGDGACGDGEAASCPGDCH